MARFSVALVVALATTLVACGGSTTPTAPSVVTVPPAPVVEPPTPTPTPAASTFSIVLGPTPGVAGVQLSLAPGNVVVGAVMTFRYLEDVTPHVVLHEMTHMGGAFHNDRPEYLMYPVLNSTLHYSAEESQVLRAMFVMSPGTECPASSSTLMLQMVCADNTADIGNPGMRSVTRVIGNVSVLVAPELSSKLDVLQAAAATWTAQSGLTVTLTVGSTTSAIRALSAGGGRMITIVD